MTAPLARAEGAPAALLQLSGIGKSFGANQVLEGVDLDITPGEVVGLLGENGAGKSTLMNIVAGALAADEGRMVFDGEERRFGSIAEGLAAGVAFVHQELSVVGALSVAENLHLGRMPRRAGLVDRRAMRNAASRMLAEVGASGIAPDAPAATLRAGEQQLVEIARAAARKPRLLILDEPTSSLTPHEVEGFTGYVRRARTEGTAIIFVTHRLDEALALCDRLVVLRNGRIVSVRRPEETSKDRIIADMTGKETLYAHPPRARAPGRVALRLERVGDGAHVEGVTLEVRQGEIFGLFGLVGAGRTELLETICGARPRAAGRIELFDEPLAPATPAEALRAGVALVPEGRKTAGILPQHSVRRNASASALRRLSAGGVMRPRDEAERVGAELRAVRVRMASDAQAITTLSGGNQQKVIFARALMSRPRLLLLDEPTHGVDVGAKAELYEIVRAAVEDGLTVLVASSEIPEIVALCDRVAVLSRGRITGVLAREEMDEADMLRLAFQAHE